MTARKNNKANEQLRHDAAMLYSKLAVQRLVAEESLLKRIEQTVSDTVEKRLKDFFGQGGTANGGDDSAPKTS